MPGEPGGNDGGNSRGDGGNPDPCNRGGLIIFKLPPCDDGGGDPGWVPEVPEIDPTMPPFIWTYTGDNGEEVVDNFPSNKPTFQFLVSDNYETKYPRFTELVKNLKSFIMSNRKVLSALQKWTGFSQNEIIEHLSFGSGPIIKIVPMSGAYGYFNGSENPAILNIRQNYVDALEVAPFSYTRESLSFLLSVTVLHEFVHLGAHVNGIIKGAYEFVNNFEKEAFNRKYR